jgi:hypothetical protein
MQVEPERRIPREEAPARSFWRAFVAAIVRLAVRQKERSEKLKGRRITFYKHRVTINFSNCQLWFLSFQRRQPAL